MLSDVVILALGILIVARETRVRHVLLVDGPADALGLEEIDNGRDAGVDVVHAVVGHAKGGAPCCGHVVGLFIFWY